MARPIHTVDQKNVRPPVIIVVDESATRPQGLRQEFLPKRAIVMNEMNASLLSHVVKRDRRTGNCAAGPSTRDCCSSRERKGSQRRGESLHCVLIIQSRPTPRASATRFM